MNPYKKAIKARFYYADWHVIIGRSVFADRLLPNTSVAFPLFRLARYTWPIGFHRWGPASLGFPFGVPIGKTEMIGKADWLFPLANKADRPCRWTRDNVPIGIVETRLK